MKRSPSRQKAVDTSDSSNTIVEDSQASSLMEDANELRTSQTMVTINGNVPQTTIKTSHSSPSALQTHQKATPRMGMRVNFDSKSQSHKKSSSSLGSICNCECKPKDFEKATLSPDEVKHEIVKIFVDQLATKMSVTTDSSSRSSDSPYSNYSSIRARTLQSKYSFLYNNNHMAAAAKYQPVNIIKETMIGAHDESDKSDKTVESKKISKLPPPLELNGESSQGENETEDDLSLMLVDLAQLSPITSSVVPTISVLPPTPDLKKPHSFNPTKDLEITKVNSISIKTESSFDSIDEEDEEPPYVALKTSLRRFGTLSSLERMPSEDTDEKTMNSSEEENSDGDGKQMMPRELPENSQSYRTWTSRAGSFLEESRAFLDKYLGRTDHCEYNSLRNGLRDSTNDFEEYETIEGETSGTMSGEEVWGTPTSGGENDEMHMFNNGDGRSVSSIS